MTSRFEQAWEAWNEVPAVATSSWSGGALAALHFAGVQGETVLCPSNTFMATPLAAIRAGADVQFVDCNRDDLCMSFADFEQKAEQHKPKAAFLVHIGGHIAFESEKIAAYCAENGIFLIEDCAHAHGASWNGRKPGSYGDAGVYSMYATKTVSTGEGGVLVSKRPELLEFARGFRNYGKPTYEVQGLNFRMNEFTAALGLIQVERHAGDRRLEERDRARVHGPAVSGLEARTPRRDGLRAVQIRSVRLAREVHRACIRRAVSPHPRPPCGATEHRLGREEPFLPAAVLPSARR